MVAANHTARSGMQDQHCDDRTLQCLLDETLDGRQQTVAEEHLSQCGSCQRRLESLVGDESLWTETRAVYSDTYPLHQLTTDEIDGRGSCVVGDDATVTWLRSNVTTPRQEDSDCIGHIDRYRIDSVVGTGGMGVVTAGYDRQLSRRVAIKFLAPHLTPMAPARRRFAREARAAAAIVHPSIMPIYGVSESSHVPYIVMPLIGAEDGPRSLQDRIDHEGQLDLETSLSIAAQIAEGLAAAHERGVVHRDIKPGNILLEENSPRILISDFGLARAIDDATVTVSGMVAGTPQYMSPEQAAGDEVGALSDVFSLGCVLYAMLTARPPFVAESPIAVLRKIIDTTAKPATQRMETLPPWVDDLLDQLLAKSPTNRIDSAAAAARLLRECEAHVRHPSAHALPATVQRSAGSLSTWNLSKWASTERFVLLVALLITLFVSIGITAMVWIPSGTGPSGVSNDSQAMTPIKSVPKQPIELSWEWPAFTEDAESIRSELDFIEFEFRTEAIP